MNVFELAVVAAPLAGMMSGVRAALGHGVGLMIVSAIGGLVIGAATFFGSHFIMKTVLHRVTRGQPSVRPLIVEWCLGTSVVLCAMASPFLAWFLTGWAFHFFAR